ncbi:MAG: hypothetical protein AVDCRST_MAG67-3640, partial [uncultured Solirubrobacteraceae bacterium]
DSAPAGARRDGGRPAGRPGDGAGASRHPLRRRQRAARQHRARSAVPGGRRSRARQRARLLGRPLQQRPPRLRALSLPAHAAAAGPLSHERNVCLHHRGRCRPRQLPGERDRSRPKRRRERSGVRAGALPGGHRRQGEHLQGPQPPVSGAQPGRRTHCTGARTLLRRDVAGPAAPDPAGTRLERTGPPRDMDDAQLHRAGGDAARAAAHDPDDHARGLREVRKHERRLRAGPRRHCRHPAGHVQLQLVQPQRADRQRRGERHRDGVEQGWKRAEAADRHLQRAADHVHRGSL